MLNLNLQLFGNDTAGSENNGNAAPTLDTSYISGTGEESINYVSENEGVEAPKEEVAKPPVVDDPKQDTKIDSAFAKLRREKETFEKQMKELDTWVEQNFKDYGVKNLQEYKDMMDKQLRDAKDAELREQGYDPDVIRKIIKSDPELSKALNTKEDNAENTEAEKAANDQKLVDDYKALADEFKGLVTKPEDIQPEVWDLYDKGYSLVDAYTLVNRKAIVDHAKEVARQEALNKINSKSHLKVEGDGAGETNDVHMPEDTLRMYLDMGYTKKQAFEHFKKLYK